MNTPSNIRKSLLTYIHNSPTITFSQRINKISATIVFVVALAFPGRSLCQTLQAPSAFPSNMTGTTFTLTWTASMSANLYTIDVSTSNTFTSGAYNTYGTSATTYVVSGLSPSTLYYYRLQAIKTTNPTDYSGYSTVGTATTTIAAPAPPMATSPDNATIQAAGFTARWNAVTTATSYQLDVSTQSNFSSFFINNQTVTATSYAVSGLSAATLYYYRVRASNVGGSSANSNVISTTTLTQIPTATGPTNVTSNSFTANWSATSGAASYQLDISATQNFATVLNTWSNLTGTSLVVSFSSNKALIFYRVRAINNEGLSSGNSTGILGVNPTQNYIHTTNVLVSGFTPDENNSGSVNQRNVKYDFFDGLGRPNQTVMMQASPNQQDIVQPIVFDNVGRENIKYLPVVMGSDGWIKSVTYNASGNFTGTAGNTYGNNASGAIAQDQRPFSQTLFEPSPLNRPLKDYGPGIDWYNGSKAVQHSYLFNIFGVATGQEQIIAWTMDAATSLPIRNTAVLADANSPGYYATGMLSVKSTKDEQGFEVREYVDKLGMLILKKVQATITASDLNDTSQWAQTYYIYDDFQNLIMVIPPEGVKAILSSN